MCRRTTPWWCMARRSIPIRPSTTRLGLLRRRRGDLVRRRCRDGSDLGRRLGLGLRLGRQRHRHQPQQQFQPQHEHRIGATPLATAAAPRQRGGAGRKQVAAQPAASRRCAVSGPGDRGQVWRFNARGDSWRTARPAPGNRLAGRVAICPAIGRRRPARAVVRVAGGAGSGAGGGGAGNRGGGAIVVREGRRGQWCGRRRPRSRAGGGGPIASAAAISRAAAAETAMRSEEAPGDTAERALAAAAPRLLQHGVPRRRQAAA